MYLHILLLGTCLFFLHYTFFWIKYQKRHYELFYMLLSMHLTLFHSFLTADAEEAGSLKVAQKENSLDHNILLKILLEISQMNIGKKKLRTNSSLIAVKQLSS